MADQEILAGPGKTTEDSETPGLIVYGNVGMTMQTVLSYTGMGQVPGALGPPPRLTSEVQDSCCST